MYSLNSFFLRFFLFIWLQCISSKFYAVLRVLPRYAYETHMYSGAYAMARSLHPPQAGVKSVKWMGLVLGIEATLGLSHTVNGIRESVHKVTKWRVDQFDFFTPRSRPTTNSSTPNFTPIVATCRVCRAKKTQNRPLNNVYAGVCAARSLLDTISEVGGDRGWK